MSVVSCQLCHVSCGMLVVSCQSCHVSQSYDKKSSFLLRYVLEGAREDIGSLVKGNFFLDFYFYFIFGHFLKCFIDFIVPSFWSG